MVNGHQDIRTKYSTYGNGNALVEILSIGFEPLLTPNEYKIYKEIGELSFKEKNLKYIISLIAGKLLYLDCNSNYYIWLSGWMDTYQHQVNHIKQWKKHKNDVFRSMLEKNITRTRQLYDNREFKNDDQFRNINIFESELTRCFGCEDMQHSDEIISITTYYTEIFNSIMHNGFIYKDRKYVFFTAGAGQTRCKKSTFVAEDILNANYNRLFCGLTREDVNSQGGMNTNKYLAYTSLCQTNSEIWTDFDIDRAVVVEDIEYLIPDQTVRYVYTESPDDKELLSHLQSELSVIDSELKSVREQKKELPKGIRRTKQQISHEQHLRAKKLKIKSDIIELKSKYHKTSIQKMSVSIPFTDGFGISLKKMNTTMIRLPFIKGLISYCPKRAFQDWCAEKNITVQKITDIYGKIHSISNIDYIFTKSQFKMWKYYNNVLDSNGDVIKTGWEVYKDNFKKYNCSACKCNVERKVKMNAKTNYQILQTLTTEMTDEDIKDLAAYDINNLNGIGRDVQCMLNVLGANEKKNAKMSWLQKSLILYPEMLKDFYIKSLLKNTKESMIKKFRSGKFSLNGAYTYVVPDPLACLQWWFTDMDKNDLSKFGFVQPGNVSCNLFEHDDEVDCLRSPHLDHAHCIRRNQVTLFTRKWAKSNGVYVGMQDIMSKLLMYDNDGDTLLVHNNKTIIKCAKNFQEKYHMIPNYYDMPKANPQAITDKSLFEGIVMAYHHGNIGTPSNEITKVFAKLSPESTREEIEHAIEVVSLRCVDVNFTIDYAKTLYKPTISPEIIDNYKVYSKQKVPHFFKYAKNKKEHQIEGVGAGNIDRIADVVKSNRIVFKDLLGAYSYKILMCNPDIGITTLAAENIIGLYKEVENANLRRLAHMDFSIMDYEKKQRMRMLMELESKKQAAMLIDILGLPEHYIVDVLIKALQNEVNKDTLWKLFGETIYNNISSNLKNTLICKHCNTRFVPNSDKSKAIYCKQCSTKLRLESMKKASKTLRDKKKLVKFA